MKPSPHDTQNQSVQRTALATLIAGAVVCSFLILANSLGAQIIEDDFNDGNDDGWTRFDPISAVFGSQATYSFPGGTAYRIQFPASPAPQLPPDGVGPARAGSLRLDQTYTDFFVSVDIVDWDNTKQQAFGLLGRIRGPGGSTPPTIGELYGYAFTWEPGDLGPTSGDADISIVTQEAPVDQIEQENSNIHLDNGKDYRFVLIGRSSTMEARIYELPDVENPILTLSGVDNTYTEGWCGLVVYDNSDLANQGGDVTFDNYFSSIGEPPKLTVSYDTGNEQVLVKWPVNSGAYRLQVASDLTAPIQWTDIEEFLIVDVGGFYQFTEDILPDFTRVFRLIQD